MSTDAGRATLIRELRTAARGIDHSLADEPDYERFDRAIAAIENEAAQRAIDELLTVERVAGALLETDDIRLYEDRAAALIRELRR